MPTQDFHHLYGDGSIYEVALLGSRQAQVL